MSETKTLKQFLSSYGMYLSLYIGIAFIAGAIVHYPINPSRFILIGIIGAIIFTGASSLDEIYNSKQKLSTWGVIRVTILSLILSIGIGMVSGGVQHFEQFPVYSSYLMPLGVLVSIAAYFAKTGVALSRRDLGYLCLISLVTTGVFGAGVISYGRTFSPEAHTHGGVIQVAPAIGEHMETKGVDETQPHDH